MPTISARRDLDRWRLRTGDLTTRTLLAEMHGTNRPATGVRNTPIARLFYSDGYGTSRLYHAHYDLDRIRARRGR